MKTRSNEIRSLGKVLGSRYWREDDAREVLAAWDRSKESAAAFARRQGLSPARLLRWKSRVSSGKRKPVFHPVKVIGTARSPQAVTAEVETTGTLELVVGGKRRIVIRRGFDPEVLAELVRAVESWEC